MITTYTADWVLPITEPPIARGFVAVEDGRIARVGSVGPGFEPAGRAVSLGACALLPGLVDAHSHLELSLMRGLLEERPFHTWIRDLTRIKYRLLSAEDLCTSALYGCLEATRAGITTLGDTGDSGAAAHAMGRAGLRGTFFQEVFGPRAADAEAAHRDLVRRVQALREQAGPRVRIGVSPHAPYTVSGALFARVARWAAREGIDVAIHAAESPAEVELVEGGRGPLAEALAARGIPPAGHGVRPLAYLEHCGALEAGPLLIHAVQASPDEIGIAARHGCRIAHCPKSNAKLGHGIAPLEDFLAAGLVVGLGTDSVASNNVLDMLDEARAAVLFARARGRDLAAIGPARALELATMGGARALGLADEVGSLQPGKRADLVAVRLDGIHMHPVFEPQSALVFSARAGDVALTVVDGQELYADGSFTRLDGRDIESAMDNLRARIQEALADGILEETWRDGDRKTPWTS